MLFNGHISVQLVPLPSMQSMIKSLQTYLETHHSHLTLVHTSTLYYYRESRFVAFRKGSKLYIHVQVPLSSFEPRFRIFALEKLPLAVPGTDAQYTILAHNVRAIGFSDKHYFEITDQMDLANIPKYINLNRSPIHLMSRDYPSCTVALLDGNLRAIRKLCEFHVVNGPVPKTIVRLSPTRLFVSSVSSLIIQCDQTTVDKSTETANRQIAIDIPCNCELQVDQYSIPRMARTCEDDPEDYANLTSHTVNLIYLSHFFPESTARPLSRYSIKG